MSSNYEQLKTLKEALSRYQKAKRNEQERKRKAREKRRSIVLTSVAIITAGILIMYAISVYNKYNAFFAICRSGTAEEVKAAIEKDKWDVNMTVVYDSGEITPYMLVARYNPNLEVLTFLEQAGARVDKNIALEEAARYGNDEIAKSLVQNGVKGGTYTLTWAVMREDIEMVKLLVQNGATNLNGALNKAAERNNVEIAKFLIQNGATNLNEALRIFAERNNNEMVKLLVQNGATNLNEALHRAMERNNNEIVKFLIQNGANDNYALDNYALEEFTKRRDAEMVKLLVKNGATNLNYALEKFAESNNGEMVKWLLQNGATNLNYPLEKFSERNNAEMVKFLLQKSAKHKNYALALNYVLEKFIRHNNAEMVKWLFQNGAKIDNWGKFLRDKSLLFETKKLIANARPALTEQEIITAAKKYGFEIVASKDEYKKETQNGKPPFSERVIAREESGNGCVYLCTDSVCKSESYFSSSFHHKKYSDWRNDPWLTAYPLGFSIRSWLSPELNGNLLDRAVDVLTEICY